MYYEQLNRVKHELFYVLFQEAKSKNKTSALNLSLVKMSSKKNQNVGERG